MAGKDAMQGERAKRGEGELSDAEISKRRRKKNLAVLGLLVAFCVLVYLITIVRMG